MPFPREFRRGPFRNPDWRFLSIFLACAVFLGGWTLLLSLREPQETASEKEIIHIQDRYARLVLDMPVKVVKKIRASQLQAKKDREEIAKETDKAEESAVDLEEPLLVQEVAEEEIVPAIPDIEAKPATRYEIRKDTVQIEPEEEERPAIYLAAEIPDIQRGPSVKYGMKERAAEIDTDEEIMKRHVPEMISPDIDVRSASKYNVGKRSVRVDISDRRDSARITSPAAPATPDIESRQTKRYRISGRGRRSSVPEIDLAERQAPATQIASAVPDVTPRVSRKYGSRSGGTQIATAGRYRISGSGVIPEIPVVEGKKRGTQTARVVTEVPDVQTRVSRKYAAGRANIRTNIPSPEPAKEKTVMDKEGGSRYNLPESARIHYLSACVDPAEENRIKGNILAVIGNGSNYCKDANGRYAFLYAEMLSTLDVRFASYNSGAYNRCDALRIALQCLINKRKR